MAEAFYNHCNKGGNKGLIPISTIESIGNFNGYSQQNVVSPRVTKDKSVNNETESKVSQNATDSFENKALNVFKRLLSNTNGEKVRSNKLKLNKELVDLITHKEVMNTHDLDSIVCELSLMQSEKREITKCSMLKKVEYFSQEDISVDDPDSKFKLFAFYWEKSGEIGKISILKATIPKSQIIQEYYFYTFLPIQWTSVQLNQALIHKVLGKISGCEDTGQYTEPTEDRYFDCFPYFFT